MKLLATPDVVQVAVVVEQAEEQRADAVAVLVPAEPGDHAVGRALVLHLRHHALVLLVGLVGGLGHHAVEPGALEADEPVLRDVRIVGHRREVHPIAVLAERLLEEPAPLGERLAGEITIVEGEQVEGHEAGRRLLRQHPHP